MFEAIHGSAPRRAGQNLANPSGLLLGAVMMLVHIGQPDVAERVHNAWLTTLEDGIHTYDIYDEARQQGRRSARRSSRRPSSRGSARRPQKLKAVAYAAAPPAAARDDGPGDVPRPAPVRELKGVDVYVNWDKPRLRRPRGEARRLSPGRSSG